MLNITTDKTNDLFIGFKNCSTKSNDYLFILLLFFSEWLSFLTLTYLVPNNCKQNIINYQDLYKQIKKIS